MITRTERFLPALAFFIRETVLGVLPTYRLLHIALIRR